MPYCGSCKFVKNIDGFKPLVTDFEKCANCSNISQKEWNILNKINKKLENGDEVAVFLFYNEDKIFKRYNEINLSIQLTDINNYKEEGFSFCFRENDIKENLLIAFLKIIIWSYSMNMFDLNNLTIEKSSLYNNTFKILYINLKESKK